MSTKEKPAIKTSTLRPGLLVSLKSSVRGNVTYQRRNIGTEKAKDGTVKVKWETIRTITDQAEHDAAGIARSKARGAISKVCTNSAFGLLCPETAEDELNAAIVEAQEIVDAFNAEAKLSRLGVFAITGRVAADDVQAVKAINSEVRDLLEDMQEGLKNLDVKVVREAARQAKEIGNMLSPDAQARIQIAIDAARSSAKQMVKAGEQVAMTIDNQTITKIAEMRTAFLDLGEAKKIVTPKVKSVAVDLTPTKKAKSSKVAARQVEV